MSLALVLVPNVPVIPALENVPLESAALLTVTTPELEFTPPVLAVQFKFRSVPARGAINVEFVAVVLVSALVAAPAATRYSVAEADAVPVPTAVSSTDGAAIPVSRHCRLR